jgi:hypothetical protein
MIWLRESTGYRRNTFWKHSCRWHIARNSCGDRAAIRRHHFRSSRRLNKCFVCRCHQLVTSWQFSDGGAHTSIEPSSSSTNWYIYLKMWLSTQNKKKDCSNIHNCWMSEKNRDWTTMNSWSSQTSMQALSALFRHCQIVFEIEVEPTVVADLSKVMVACDHWATWKIPTHIDRH